MPLNVDPSSDGVSVSFNITNIGNREGMEVAQLYIRDLECSVPRPLKELKGFEKIYLRAGETKNVNLFLNQRSFQFYNPEKKAWMSEPGKFEVLIGSSSKDIWLNGQIMMK